MKHLLSLFASLVVPIFMLAVANPAIAQDKAKDAKATPAAKAEKGKPIQKVLFEDDRVRVTETTYRPGDKTANNVRGFRVSRALSNGTIKRTHADGKVETIERKTGDVRVQGPDKLAYVQENIGKANYVVYTVNIKGAKK